MGYAIVFLQSKGPFNSKISHTHFPFNLLGTVCDDVQIAQISRTVYLLNWTIYSRTRKTYIKLNFSQQVHYGVLNYKAL